MSRNRWYLIKRWFRYTKQKLTRGFSDKDLWNLDVTIAEFIRPRLVAFKKYSGGLPCDYTEAEWHDKLDRMILAFEDIEEQRMFSAEWSEDRQKETDEGLKIFAQHFQTLWD